MTRRVPELHGVTAADCGAACLAMVMRAYGLDLPLDDVRAATGTGRDGVDALSLVEAARGYGFEAEGLQLPLEELANLSCPAILHWDMRHFVVLERALPDGGAEIVDPAFGRLRLTAEELDRSFTGIALTVQPGPSFIPRVERPGTWSSYLTALRPQRTVLLWAAALSLLVQLLALLTPLLTAWIVDRVVPQRQIDLLRVISVSAVAMLAFHFLVLVTRAQLLLSLRTILDRQWTAGFLRHLLKLPLSFFAQRSAGDLMMRVNSNTVAREIITSAALSTVLDGTFALGYLLAIALVRPSFAILALLLASANVVLFVATRSSFRRRAAAVLQAQAQTEGYLVEMIAGLETLKSMGVEAAAADRWERLFIQQLNAGVRQGRLGSWLESAAQTFDIAAPLLMLLVGVHQVLEGSLTLGTLLGLTGLTVGFLLPVTKLTTTALQLQIFGSYIERMNEVLTAHPEQAPSTALIRRPLLGAIRVEAMSYCFTTKSPPMLRDISLQIDSGSFVALVGRSGAGKSTLARVLCGLNLPSSGRVLFDEIELTQWDLVELRRQLGIVVQEPQLFSGSVRDNIALAAPGADLASIVRAAQLAGIRAEIEAMPLGFETPVGDGGLALAAGQRQRLALARALVRQPRLLLLDEATSALDTVTERQIQQNLSQLRCTRVVIAHRLSTIVEADQIVVIDGGTLVEKGTHAGLLAAGGHYAQLVQSQLRGPASAG